MEEQKEKQIKRFQNNLGSIGSENIRKIICYTLFNFKTIESIHGINIHNFSDDIDNKDDAFSIIGYQLSLGNSFFNNRDYDDLTALKLCIELFLAVEYIHLRNFSHLNISSDNIQIYNNNSLKLSGLHKIEIQNNFTLEYDILCLIFVIHEIFLGIKFEDIDVNIVNMRKMRIAKNKIIEKFKDQSNGNTIYWKCIIDILENVDTVEYRFENPCFDIIRYFINPFMVYFEIPIVLKIEKINISKEINDKKVIFFNGALKNLSTIISFKMFFNSVSLANFLITNSDSFDEFIIHAPNNLFFKTCLYFICKFFCQILPHGILFNQDEEVKFYIYSFEILCLLKRWKIRNTVYDFYHYYFSNDDDIKRVFYKYCTYSEWNESPRKLCRIIHSLIK